MKEQLKSIFHNRICHWTTIIGVLIIFFGISYHEELSDFVSWFFLYPFRQLITNVVTDKEFTSKIIEVIAFIIGGMYIKHKKNKE